MRTKTPRATSGEKRRELTDDPRAALSFEEIDDERRWIELFARSPEVLERLVAEANRDIAAGRTRPLDPEQI